MNKSQLVAILMIAALCVVHKLYDVIREQREQIERLERNVEAMNDAQIEYKTKLGDAAVKRKALEMSHKELKKQNADLYKEVKALDVRLKDALSVSKVVTKTVIKEVVRTDTINGVAIAEYRDPWNMIRSEQRGDGTELTYQGNDTIVGVISIRKKRFLFFRWGVKSVDYDISNKNPKTKANIDIAVKFR